jgi:hypothetical protein
MPISCQIKVRIALLALEKEFSYAKEEDLATNIAMFLTSCELSSYEKRIGYTFVLEKPS